MKKKAVCGAIVLLLIVTAAGAGCTLPTTTSPSPSATTSPTTATTSPSLSPTATSTTHDALLEKLAAALYNTTGNLTVTSWDVQWANSTTVKIQASGFNQNGTSSWSMNDTFIRFPSNDAATTYLQTYNRSGYTYFSPNDTTDSLYYEATGRLPTVYQGYVNWLAAKDLPSQVTQSDDVISIMVMRTTLSK